MRPSPWKAPDATTVSSAILFHWATRFGPLAAAGDELPATMVPARHRAEMIPTAGLPGQVRSELCMFVPPRASPVIGPAHLAGRRSIRAQARSLRSDLGLHGDPGDRAERVVSRGDWEGQPEGHHVVVVARVGPHDEGAGEGRLEGGNRSIEVPPRCFASDRVRATANTLQTLAGRTRDVGDAALIDLDPEPDTAEADAGRRRSAE